MTIEVTVDPAQQATAIRLLMSAGGVPVAAMGSTLKLDGLTPTLAASALVSLQSEAEADALAEAKAAASSRTRQAIAAFAGSFSEGLSRETVSAWSYKAAEARAHVAGTPSGMIAAEVEESGEDPMALAQRIVAKADFYVAMIARLDGLGNKARHDIENATTAPDVQAVVDHVTARLTAFANDAAQHAASMGGANA